MEYTSHSLQTQKREKTEKECPKECTIAGCSDNKLVGAPYVYLKRFENSTTVFIIPMCYKNNHCTNQDWVELKLA